MHYYKIRFHALQKKKVIPGWQNSNKVQGNIVFFRRLPEKQSAGKYCVFPTVGSDQRLSLFCWCFCKPPGLIKINHGGYAHVVGVNILIPGDLDKSPRKSWSKVKTSRAYRGEKADPTNRKKKAGSQYFCHAFFLFCSFVLQKQKSKDKKDISPLNRSYSKLASPLLHQNTLSSLRNGRSIWSLSI